MMLNIFKNAIIRKISYTLVAIVIAFFTNQVFAFTYPPNFDTWLTNFNPATYAASPTASCQLFATVVGWTYVSTTNIRANVATCNYDDNGISRSNTTALQPTCPNGTLQGTIGNFSCFVANCTPPEVNDPVDGSCNVPNNNLCDTLEGTSTSYFSHSDNLFQCKAGCEVERDSGQCGYSESNQYGCILYGIYTGTQCTGDLTPNPIQSTPEFDCIQQGLSYGTVNGQIVCVPNGTQGTPITESTNTSESSTTDSTGTTSTTTDQTVNSDGTVTTTTTTTDPNGGITTETQTDELPSFCESNPNSQICKEDEPRTSSGGLTCDTAPLCDGDSIDCVIQRQIWTHRCHSEQLAEAFDSTTESDDYKTFDPSTNPTDADATAALNSDGSSDIDIDVILATELAEGHIPTPVGTCPPPVSLTFLSAIYTLDLNVFCDLAIFFKFFFLAFASLTSLRIFWTVLA